MKNIMLSAVIALCALGSHSCKKDDYKPDIVKYKIDGKEKIIEGVYSDISLYGLDIIFKDDRFGVTAYHKSFDFDFFIGRIKYSTLINEEVFFEDATITESSPILSMSIRKSGSWKVYFSTNEKASSMTLLQNNAQCVEGTFSGTLYNNTTSASSSDSVLITDGYFYLNKE